MFPVHQFELYPHQRNQMQSAPQCYPSFEAIPPKMRADLERLYYQPWPCSSNYGYTHPAQFHGCCEHNHFHGYYGSRSPYAQPPLPYYHGSYPVPPGAYPFHHIPPPHHTVELPHYEYGKDVHGYYHCCGCPNHSHNQKAGKNVKFEEEGPRLENKVDGSLVPFNFRDYPNPLVWHSLNNIKNKEENRSSEQWYEVQDSSNRAKTHYPYPSLWFPSNYTMNKEDIPSNEQQSEKQEDNSSSAKTNYPYPLFWVPPNAVRNKDGVSNEPLCERQEGSSYGSKTGEISEPPEQHQNFMNGWFPFDMKNLRPSKSLTLRQQQQQQGNDKPGFPFPVFWMPYKPDERESKGDKQTGVGQEWSRTPAMVPYTEEDNKREMNDEIIGHEGPKLMKRTNGQKTIPVKQAELQKEETNMEQTKSSGMPSNHGEAGKSSENGAKREFPSSPKSSKLPPVCLRVDPLPRKKNANGSSRSPSPPGDKGKLHEASRENVKPATSLAVKEISEQDIQSRNVMPEGATDKEQHKSKKRSIQVSEGTGSQVESCDSPPDGSNKGVLASQTSCRPQDAVDDLAATDVKCKNVVGVNNEGAVESCDSLPDSSREGLLASQTTCRPRDTIDDLAATDIKSKNVAGANNGGVVEDKSINLSCQIDENEEKSKAEEKSSNKAKEPKMTNLSEAEAARIIQSAYRGYEVRRWEPLKKLKQVMEVSKKVGEIKSSIQAFESSPDMHVVEKWKTVVSETIMNLLLKLDTIQGMHPSIRYVRKSVARELVGLQEKVDYLTQRKDETLTQQDSTVLSAENMDKRDDLCIKDGKEEQKQDQENSQPETDPANEFHQEVACQGESNPSIHALTNSENLDISEIQKSDPRIDAFTNSQNPDIPAIVVDDSKNPWEPITQTGSAETELRKSVVFSQVGDQTINTALGKTCSLLKNEVSELKELEELPKGELKEDTCMQDNVVRNKAVKDRAPEDEVSMNELPKGVLDENIDIEDNNLLKNDAGENEVFAESYLESKELAQLPQGVLGDDDNKSSKHLHVKGEEGKGKTDAVTVDVNAKAADEGVLHMNQALPGQETTHKVRVISEVNVSSGCVEDEESKVELLKMVDLGPNDAVQAPEEETSVKSKAVDEPEVHGKEGTGSKSEVFNCAKSEGSGYFAVENEIPIATTATEPKEFSETCEEVVPEISFVESESRCTSGGEKLTDASNSSSKDTPRECDFPVKLSKSCNVEHDEKQRNDNFELQASGGAVGVDGTFVQTCDSGTLEGELSDHVESISLEAKQAEERELPPLSPTASQISLESDAFLEGDKKLIEENVRLREMMQKLIEAGQEQLTAISNLSARIKDLEKRISKKKKLKMRRNGTSRLSSGSSCLKPSNDPLKGKAVALAM